jgi:hypothetical protein
MRKGKTKNFFFGGRVFPSSICLRGRNEKSRTCLAPLCTPTFTSPSSTIGISIPSKSHYTSKAAEKPSLLYAKERNRYQGQTGALPNQYFISEKSQD